MMLIKVYNMVQMDMSTFSAIKCHLCRLRARLDALRTRARQLKFRLALGVLANAVYIIWNLALAAVYRDALLLSVSVYYVFLALMRCVLLAAERRGASGSVLERASFTVGLLLVTAGAAFGAVMVYTLAFEVKKNYSPVSIIPQSLFLLYCLIGATVRISRRTEGSFEMRLANDVIALAATLFSVFNLVNYLSHTQLCLFDRSITLAVGCVAVTVIFVAAVRLMLFSRNR